MELASTQAVVLDVLQRASSQNPEILKPAEEKLKEWETQIGFYPVLFSIISNHDLDVNVRWMAVLYLKNGIDKYWRRNAPNAITEEEKENIRQGFLCNFSEPVNQIAVQRAVVVSKIARIDCPKEWPQLFPTLVQAVQSQDILVQHRALETLHQVVKTIASKRLLGDRRFFQEFTSNIYTFVLNLWNNFTQQFINSIMQDASGEIITKDLENALLTLRILRKLTVYGFHKPHENQDCMSFLKVIFEKAKAALQCRKQLKGKGIYVLELCEKFIIHLTKVLISVIDTHPFSFVGVIQPSLEFTFYYLFTDEGISYLFERFLVQCFLLIRNILVCVEYRIRVPELVKHEETFMADQIKKAFFQPETVSIIVKKIILHYFVLTQDELDLWDSDPEAFANDLVSDGWKYCFRPSVNMVFAALFAEYRPMITPLIMELVAETNVLVPPEDMQGILKKDAVYNAVELCALDLYDEINFDQWFTNTLTRELKVKHNNYRVLRRRILGLISHWTGVNFSINSRPSAYGCIVDLMKSNEDMVIRLTAASTLRSVVDDFDFDIQNFRDYVFSAFNLLFDLLRESSECETKMRVLTAMTVILERMGEIIRPNHDTLMQYLPHLWKESEGHNLLRSAIVATLVRLLKSLEDVKPELYPFLLPIIQLGTDTNQNAIVYLLEDCLDLWLAVLEYSTSMTSELMQLFSNMPSLLEYSTENLRQCFLICTAQLVLDPELVLRTSGQQIIQVCDGLISDLKHEAVVMLLRHIEMCIRVAPVLGSETVMPILPRVFQQVYLGEEYPRVLSMYLCITSRVLLSSHDVFTRALNNLAQAHNENEQVTLGKMLNVWVMKMPEVTQLDQRKLLGLALINLLTTQSTQVLERFEMIMCNIVESLNDITRSESNGALMDALILTDEQSARESIGWYSKEETNHDNRSQELVMSDPVHTIVMKDYLQSQVYELRNQIGLQQYQQLIQSLQPDTISQLREYITF